MKNTCTTVLLHIIIVTACFCPVPSLGSADLLDMSNIGFNETYITTTSSLLDPHITTNQTNTDSNEPLNVRASRYLQYKIGKGIQTYYLPVVIPIGLTGNFLAALVLISKGNRDISCYIYLTALAVYDWLLMALALYYWLVSDILTNGWTEIECKCLVWLFHFLTTDSTWIVVLMTIDRFIAVIKPLKVASWCRPSQARIFLCILAVCAALYCIPHAFYTTVLPTGRSCAGLTTNDGLLGLIYSWCGLLVNCLIPFSIILTLNVAILVHLRRTKNKFAKHEVSDNSSTATRSVDFKSEAMTMSGEQQTQDLPGGDHDDYGNGVNSASTSMVSFIEVPNCPSGNNMVGSCNRGCTGFSDVSQKGVTTRSINKARKHQRQYLNAILLLVSLTMLVLTAPQYIRYIFYEFYNFLETPDRYANYILFFHITQKLYYTNSAINFFLYCIAGSKFRSDLKNLLRCKMKI